MKFAGVPRYRYAGLFVPKLVCNGKKILEEDQHA